LEYPEPNGFTMTGNGSQGSCAFNSFEVGIDSNGENNVFIRGPGLVRRFNSDGILVRGDHSSVEGVAVTSICENGIAVVGSGDEVQGNSVSRAALSFGEGIEVGASGGHRILNNEVVGEGPFTIPSVVTFRGGIVADLAQLIISFQKTPFRGIPEGE
jgi:hypothetical protein